MKVDKTCDDVIRPDSYWGMKKDERTSDCMSREGNGCSANICHSIFVEVEWTNTRYHTGVKQFWRLKLMSHTVKLFERIINHMPITIVELGTIHFVFRRGRSTMDSAFVLQFLQETYKEKPQDLHMTSADRLSVHRFDIENHVNVRHSRGVCQCA